MFDFGSSPLLSLRTEGERSVSVFGLSVAFLIIMMCSSVIQSFLIMPVILLASFRDIIAATRAIMQAGQDGMDAALEEYGALIEEIMSSSAVMIVNLFSTVGMIVLVILYCRFFERRSLATMGIARGQAVRRYAVGALIGTVLFALAFGICALSDSISLSSLNRDVSIPLLLLYLLGYAVQGAAEELLVRGFLMLSLSRHTSGIVAVLISAAVFAAMHIGNVGVSYLAVLNIFLFGVFLGFFTLRTGSLIGACAIHSFWNFAEGNLYGCKVSGMTMTETLFHATAEEGRVMTNGGAFGPEGGLAVTLVCMLAILAVCLLPRGFFGRKKDRRGV